MLSAQASQLPESTSGPLAALGLSRLTERPSSMSLGSGRRVVVTRNDQSKKKTAALALVVEIDVTGSFTSRSVSASR
jgi:hypothetical protein